MKTKLLITAMVVSALLGCNNVQASPTAQSDASAANKIDRAVLPIQPPKVAPIAVMDARNATKPARFEVKPPEGAPNGVIVLIDDIGFGATKPFGGAIETPTLERLANEGLRFNQFHTTA